MAQKRHITPSDILPPPEFEAVRKEKRAALVARKKLRRIEVGPYATFYFENYETMWWQIQEMLRIEKGGAAQLTEELAAYNPLVPRGAELVATLMFEIDDADRRGRVLARLGGVEETVTLKVGDSVITAVPEDSEGRTTPDGKTSSVHFVRFPFTPAQVAAFKTSGAQVILGLAHANYGHLALVAESSRAALAGDLD
jgi:hypothetical protein